MQMMHKYYKIKDGISRLLFYVNPGSHPRDSVSGVTTAPRTPYKNKWWGSGELPNL